MMGGLILRFCVIAFDLLMFFSFDRQHGHIQVILMRQNRTRSVTEKLHWFGWSPLCGAAHSLLSFPVMHEVDNVGIYVLLKFKNNLDEEISHFSFNSKHHDKVIFALKLIWLLTVYNLEVAQKCQCCQLCVLRKTMPCVVCAAGCVTCYCTMWTLNKTSCCA